MAKVRLLRLPDVERKCGLKKSAIYSLAREGKFPAPIRLTDRASAWSSKEVDSWIAAKLLESGREVLPEHGNESDGD